jgi:hypothetical protein
MVRITDRRIRRLLTSSRAEPPDGLADRIKAEIPEMIQVGGVAPRESLSGLPARGPAFRPLWLLAASLLVVIGAGFVAVRFFAPTSDLAREIALGGVVRIEDIVVTVPERSTVERRALAADSAAAAPSAAARAPQPARVAAKAMAPQAAIGGSVETAKGSIVVVARDAAGKPLAGATVLLARDERPAVGAGFRVTGSGGGATFCCVAPGTYRLCAQLPGFAPASTDGVAVAPGRQTEVGLILTPPPPGASGQGWTCPTAKPAGRQE